jgi:hypothetical protein
MIGTELWYKNPKVLLENMDQFFPSGNLNRIEKINSLARFAIYYYILVLLFNDDKKWGSISIIILLISLFLGTSENFTLGNVNADINVEKCQKPTKNNPFMNYTVGDLIQNSDRSPACKVDDVNKEIRKEFRSHLYSDPYDMWGKNISDRSFYTMPCTSIVNDQIGLGMACLGNSGDCKTFRQNCLKVNDIMYHTARLQHSR